MPLVPLQIHVFSHMNVTCVSKTRIQNRKKRIQNMYFAYPKLNVRVSKNRIHNFVNVSKNEASRIQTYPKLAYPKCTYPKNRIQNSYPKCVSKMKHLKCFRTATTTLADKGWVSQMMSKPVNDCVFPASQNSVVNHFSFCCLLPSLSVWFQRLLATMWSWLLFSP